ncbi:MAG TPA: glycosyltransferase family 2 protein [Polyangiaceae bacterium]|nr:glycosyltransferase family 2 protein [Polyangiaceae bacterium]
MRVSFLIPVFNEEATVGEVLRRVASCDVASDGFEREILVCDDGSTDGTLDAIAAVARLVPQVRVLSHATNRGKGAAVRTLLKEATGDAVLIQDADLEYEVEDCLPLLRRFREGADAVYGSRFLEASRPAGMHAANLVANRILTATANALYDHRITDEATCLKLIRTSLLRRMDLQCEGFDFCPEVTAKLGLMGVEIVEVPVRYRARDGTGGKKVRWPDGFIAMRVLLEQRLRGGWRLRARRTRR